MSEHTPGKWVVGEYVPTESFKKIDLHICVYREEDRMLIACCGKAEHPKSLVDARLISVAPLLLEQCEDFALWFADTYGEDELQKEFPRLAAVVAEARGEPIPDVEATDG